MAPATALMGRRLGLPRGEDASELASARNRGGIPIALPQLRHHERIEDAPDTSVRQHGLGAVAGLHFDTSQVRGDQHEYAVVVALATDGPEIQQRSAELARALLARFVHRDQRELVPGATLQVRGDGIDLGLGREGQHPRRIRDPTTARSSWILDRLGRLGPRAKGRQRQKQRQQRRSKGETPEYAHVSA